MRIYCKKEKQLNKELTKMAPGYVIKNKRTGERQKFKYYKDMVNFLNRLPLSEYLEWSGWDYA